MMMAKEMVHAAVDATAEQFYPERRGTKTSDLSALDTSLLDSNKLDRACVDVQLCDDRQSMGLRMCRSEVQRRRPGQER